MERKTILLVDDDQNLRSVLKYNLEQANFDVLEASSGESALQTLDEHEIHLVVTDLRMEGMQGMEFLDHVKKRYPETLVIVITAYGSIASAVEAMKKGAFDYITKPIDREVLLLAVRKALRFEALSAENVRLREALAEKFSFAQIVGTSPVMQELFRTMARVAPKTATVLIRGESGTGKELIAKAIHYNSPRSAKALVTVNCTAIPRELLESELFGYVKGAFTGASKDKPGKFELAEGGTIFLDEIGDLNLELQGKLLRVLQEREIDKVGGKMPIKVDVRLMAATNHDIEKMVSEGLFRRDLYYRLSVVPIFVPPLRARKDDLPLLVKHFLHKYHAPETRVTPGVWKILRDHDWPGNVRELENVVERALILQKKEGEISEDDLVLSGVESPFALMETRRLPEEGLSLDQVEKNLIIAALEKTGWNQSQAAKLLSISRQTIIYRMQKYGIAKPAPSAEEHDKDLPA